MGIEDIANLGAGRREALHLFQFFDWKDVTSSRKVAR